MLSISIDLMMIVIGRSVGRSSEINRAFVAFRFGFCLFYFVWVSMIENRFIGDELSLGNVMYCSASFRPKSSLENMRRIRMHAKTCFHRVVFVPFMFDFLVRCCATKHFGLDFYRSGVIVWANNRTPCVPQC